MDCGGRSAGWVSVRIADILDAGTVERADIHARICVLLRKFNTDTAGVACGCTVRTTPAAKLLPIHLFSGSTGATLRLSLGTNGPARGPRRWSRPRLRLHHLNVGTRLGHRRGHHCCIGSTRSRSHQHQEHTAHPPHRHRRAAGWVWLRFHCTDRHSLHFRPFPVRSLRRFPRGQG